MRVTLDNLYGLWYVFICMKRILSMLITSLIGGFTTSLSGQPLPPPPPSIPVVTNTTVTSLTTTQTPIFYDSFPNGYNTPWVFYQGSHQFTTNGTLNLSVAYNAGTYAYVKTNYTNISVQTDVRLNPKSWGAAVGVRYNWTNGANYQAWLYQSNSTAWPSRFTIEKYNNWYQSWSQVAGMSIPDPSTNWHTVKITATNNIIAATLDGSYALIYTDTTSPLLKGGFDLGVWGGLNAMNADFDNVTVYDLNATNGPPPTLIPQISSMTKRVVGYQGGDMTFTVVANNNPTSYQWYFGGAKTAIADATNSSLTVNNTKTANAGYYRVDVTNSSGMVYGTANASVFTTNVLSNCNPNTNTTATVKLAWDYDFIINPTVYAFRLYNGTASQTYTNIVNISGQVLTGQVTNVPVGLTSYFAATAVDTNGLESGYSNEASTNIQPIVAITNMALQIYWLDSVGYPAIQTKMCPFQNATLWYRTNLVAGSWVSLTNWVADQYGNAVYDDAGAKGSPQRFYRATTP